MQSTRATVYLDPQLHRALKLKAIETSKSVPGLINKAVRAALAEDAEDIEAFEERAAEPLTSYDEMVKKLKKMAGYRVFFKKFVEKDLAFIPAGDGGSHNTK